MLRQRVLTAVVLLLVLAGVLGSGSLLVFYLTLAIFFGAMRRSLISYMSLTPKCCKASP